MTTTRPIALLLAAAMFAALWVPTLAAPDGTTVVLAALA